MAIRSFLKAGYYELLERVYAKSGGLCWYCGIDRCDRTIDHVVPISSGGTDDESNLVGACTLCNSLKGVRTVEEFRVAISRDKAGWPYFKPAQLEWLERNVSLPTLELVRFHGEKPRIISDDRVRALR